MQKFEGTLITDNGLNLLTTVNGGDDKIQYTKAVLAADDFTQASSTAIQKITGLTIKMSSPISINSRINDTINLSASFTNETITEDFDFYCIGWYAKGVKDSTEYLIAVSPSTVKQTMPAGSNNAATAAISPKYAMTLSRSAEVVVNTNPAGSVTKEYVDNQVNALIAEGIINNGSIVSTIDDCNKMITTSYHLVKGSLPLNAPDGFSTNGQIIVYGNKDTTDGVTQLAYDDINGVSYVRSYNPTNNQWSTWDLIITKSQLHAVLPTDIARTGETNEFKAKNTFDVDPVNKDGNSYGLAKDIATKVTDNGDNSIEINKQAVTPVRDNKNGSINFNSKDMTPADDSAVVHTTGDETIDGQKKFKTDPTDGAGNAYAKTVDVNQQLDKKVNVADMRKAPSDVAGIEEVNAKADDSKVVHTADMRKPASDVVGLEDVSTSVYRRGLEKNTDLNALTQEGIYNFGVSLVNFIDSDSHWGTIYVTNKSAVVFQYVITTSRAGNQIYFRTQSGNPAQWVPWTMVSAFGMDNYVTLPNGEQLKPADDSKVAHLSGANNFDTTPTVNNNPLLLASSLPSDLARTGQAQTFTQPQTFSIAPTIKDASTDKGDNQAATMADLKSVENSAWHFLKTKDVGGDFDINMLYFEDYKSDYIRIIFLADSNVHSKTYSNYRIVVDMSKVITSFSESSSIYANLSLGQYMTGDITGTEQGTANFVIATISGTLGQYESVTATTDLSSGNTGGLGEFRGIDFKVNGFI